MKGMMTSNELINAKLPKPKFNVDDCVWFFSDLNGWPTLSKIVGIRKSKYGWEYEFRDGWVPESRIKDNDYTNFLMACDHTQ